MRRVVTNDVICAARLVEQTLRPFHQNTVLAQRSSVSGKIPPAASTRRPPSPTRSVPNPVTTSTLNPSVVASSHVSSSVAETHLHRPLSSMNPAPLSSSTTLLPSAATTTMTAAAKSFPPATLSGHRQTLRVEDLLAEAAEEEAAAADAAARPQPSSEAAKQHPTRLLYCALNGKTVLEGSAVFHLLVKLGFQANERAELVLTHHDVLDQFGKDLWEKCKEIALPAVNGSEKTKAVEHPAAAASNRQALIDAQVRTFQDEISASWPMWLKRAVLPAVRHASYDGSSVAMHVQKVIARRASQQRLKANAFDVQRAMQQGDAATESQAQRNVDAALHGVELNDEQETMVQLVLRGYHTYIAGSAGTGKTVLLRGVQRRLQDLGLRVAMSATTGIAGCHIGGSTFHHAMGINVHGEFLKPEEMLQYDVVIIDEVSMLGLKLFEDFDRILREQAGTPDLPFGGLQVVLCGDFLQLSAINEKCLIESDLFQRYFVKAKLQKQVRQAENPEFANMLMQVRLGNVPPMLKEKIPQLPPKTLVDGAVNLLPTNDEVYRANARELARLPGESLRFAPLALPPTVQHRSTPTILSRLVFPDMKPDRGQVSLFVRKILETKFGVLPHGMHVSFYPVFEDGFVLRVVFNSAVTDEFCAEVSQEFLQVAAVLADHFPQLKVTEIVPSNGTEGMCPAESEEMLRGYTEKHVVAKQQECKIGARVMLRANLSQTLVNGSIGTVCGYAPCHSSSILSVLLDEHMEKNIAQYANFCITEGGMSEALLPIVKFANGDEIVIPPWQFEVGGAPATQYYSQRVLSLPLSLGYAFTVHKVQGLTLVGRVHLELSNMWPCDHLLYVAMSRVKNPEQLSMSAFEDRFVVSSADCLAFDASLPSVSQALVPVDLQPAQWRKVIRDARHGMISPLYASHTSSQRAQQRRAERAERQRLLSSLPEGVVSVQQKLEIESALAPKKKSTISEEEEDQHHTATPPQTTSSPAAQAIKQIAKAVQQQKQTTTTTTTTATTKKEASRSRQAKRLATLAERYLRKVPSSTPSSRTVATQRRSSWSAGMNSHSALEPPRN